MLAAVNNTGIAAQGMDAARKEKLEQSAHEFEASLIAELTKPLQNSDGLSEDDSGGALQDFASESLARAISEHGGFGIANQILAQLEKSHGGTAHGASPESASSARLKFPGSRPI